MLSAHAFSSPVSVVMQLPGLILPSFRTHTREPLQLPGEIFPVLEVHDESPTLNNIMVEGENFRSQE